MDARVVAELQHVEVAPLHALPDAVDAGDVRTLVLHGEQRPHHLLVPVMLEVRGGRQEPRQPQQESPEPGGGPTLQHGASAQAEAKEASERHEPQLQIGSLYIPNILLTPSPAPPTNSPPSEEQVRTAPYSFFV